MLFNGAGFVHHGSVLDCSEADWDFSFDLNVKSMHRTIRAFLPGHAGARRGLDRQRGVRRLLGARHPEPLRLRHQQGGGVGLSKAVAADFIKRGIRCNAICPGTIESPSLDDRIDALAASTGQTREAVHQAFVDRQPMGRLGTAHEVAMLAVYLASDESRYTTGTIHLVDGGFSL